MVLDLGRVIALQPGRKHAVWSNVTTIVMDLLSGQFKSRHGVVGVPDSTVTDDNLPGDVTRTVSALPKLPES
ncbi:PotC [Salmonella phage 21]|nr:PotC [Salmonella phage 21]